MEKNAKRLSKKLLKMPLIDKYSNKTWKDAEEVNNFHINFILKLRFCLI